MNRTERIRTHLTPALLRLELFERRGDPRDLERVAEALARALDAVEKERAPRLRALGSDR